MSVLQPLPAAAPLILHYLPGRTGKLVVALAGIGTRPDRAPEPEFVASAHDGGQNHVLFVSDNSRSWLNHPGLAEAITAAVRGLAAQIGAERVLALGNSMGGTMALMLAPMLRPDFILAFVPQFSIHPDLVPDETRYEDYSRSIAQWRYPAVPDLEAAGIGAIIVHGNRSREGLHWRRFPQAHSRVLHFIIPRAGHSLARLLNTEGRLHPMIRAAARGNVFRIRQIIREAGGVSRHIYETRHPAPAKEA